MAHANCTPCHLFPARNTGGRNNERRQVDHLRDELVQDLRSMAGWRCWGMRMELIAIRPSDFAPDLLSIQEQPPARLPRTVGYVTATLFAVLLAWAAFGKL